MKTDRELVVDLIGKLEHENRLLRVSINSSFCSDPIYDFPLRRKQKDELLKNDRLIMIIGKVSTYLLQIEAK